MGGVQALKCKLFQTRIKYRRSIRGWDKRRLKWKKIIRLIWENHFLQGIHKPQSFLPKTFHLFTDKSAYLLLHFTFFSVFLSTLLLHLSSSSSGTGLHFEILWFLSSTPWSPSSVCFSSSSSSLWCLPCWGCSYSEDSQYQHTLGNKPSLNIRIVCLLYSVYTRTAKCFLSFFFSCRFNFETGTPPTNFDTFAAAIMTVFQVRNKESNPFKT